VLLREVERSARRKRQKEAEAAAETALTPPAAEVDEPESEADVARKAKLAELEAAKKLLLAAGAGEVGNATAAFQVKAVGAAVKVLDLSHLDITELPVALKECSELEELKLRGNCLQRVPGWVWALPKLRKIDLAQNDLKELPHAVGSARLLEELDLRDNPGLADLCMELLQLEKLTTLQLGVEQEGSNHCGPMKNPPQEVCKKGLEAIKSFLRDSLQGTTPNMQVKVLLLGLAIKLLLWQPFMTMALYSKSPSQSATWLVVL
jgi:hypothetical protein